MDHAYCTKQREFYQCNNFDSLFKIYDINPQNESPI